MYVGDDFVWFILLCYLWDNLSLGRLNESLGLVPL